MLILNATIHRAASSLCNTVQTEERLCNWIRRIFGGIHLIALNLQFCLPNAVHHKYKKFGDGFWAHVW